MKNKSTLGLLVAVTGVKNGHEVKLFLAADGVHLLNCMNEGEVVGQGTGDVKVHLEALKEAKTKIFVFASLSASRWTFTSPVPCPTTSPSFMQLRRWTPSAAKKSFTSCPFFTPVTATSKPRVDLFFIS